MRAGYHYTSYRNWVRIRREGLVPHPNTHQELMPFLGDTALVWLWPRRLRGRAHLGQLVWQLVKQGQERIVVLRCLYDPEVLPAENVRHDGAIENWKFHDGERAVVVAGRIPPERIECVADYNMLEWARRRGEVKCLPG